MNPNRRLLLALAFANLIFLGAVLDALSSPLTENRAVGWFTVVLTGVTAVVSVWVALRPEEQ